MRSRGRKRLFFAPDNSGTPDFRLDSCFPSHTSMRKLTELGIRIQNPHEGSAIAKPTSKLSDFRRRHALSCCQELDSTETCWTEWQCGQKEAEEGHEGDCKSAHLDPWLADSQCETQRPSRNQSLGKPFYRHLSTPYFVMNCPSNFNSCPIICLAPHT
jgi:hypothetical protein